MNRSNEKTLIYHEDFLIVMANLCKGSPPPTHDHVNSAIKALCGALVKKDFTDKQILKQCF
jgi:hypothetical protein